MPGSGKSVIGVLLAKCLGLRFVDTDLLIQEAEGRLLQDILETDGVEAFLRIEERVLRGLRSSSSVISTGGSAVYSESAMTHLRSLGKTVYLELPCDELENRVKNITTRGIVMRKKQTLGELCLEREPLYARYADVTVDCSGRSVEETLGDVLAALGHDGLCAEG
jgi:shikimate kinase